MKHDSSELFLAFLLFIGLVVGAIAAQTKINEDQSRLKVRVVEWQKCTWSSPDGKVSCVGLELVRFLMSDGTIKGPYIMIPPNAEYQHDPSKWVPVIEFTK